MGYDISDYKAIDEKYGTLEDWDGLVTDLHGRGMKLMFVFPTSMYSILAILSRLEQDGSRRKSHIRPSRLCCPLARV